MEPAAGNEGSRAHAVAGAITVAIARRRFQHLVSLRLLLGSVYLSPIEKSHNVTFWKIVRVLVASPMPQPLGAVVVGVL